MNEVVAIKGKKQIEKVKGILKKSNLRDYLLFVMGINTGLRISDLLRLKVSDILNESGRPNESIKIKEIKTGKTKLFYINEAVGKAMAEYMKSGNSSPDSYLFRSRKGNNMPISRVQAYRIINEACSAAKISGSCGCHSTRKAFGYMAYQQGIDITLLMKIFNHSSPSITLRYIGITDEQINQVYVNLNL